ncbi:Sushi [Mactra antiquata]
MATNCTVIAQPTVIITKYNIDSLLLSNYNTSPGSEVAISCLSKSTHRLVGTSILKCLPSGQWNDDIPYCERIKPSPNPSVTLSPNQTAEVPGTASETCITDYINVPYLVTILILFLLCIVLIILLCYSNRVWKRKRRSSSLIYAFDEGTRSSSPSQAQTDLWVEMANPHHFRSHELALGDYDNNLIKDIRYTPIYPSWSGY